MPRCRRLAFLAGFGYVVGACQEPAREGTPTIASSATLPDSVVATVGSVRVEATLVERVAKEQKIGVEEARDRVIEDVLLAAHAESLRDAPHLVPVAARSGLARAMLEEIDREVRAAGAPTDAEIDRVTAEQWLDFDRPPSARTIHFVAITKSAEDEGPAKALAERFAELVEPVTTEERFREVGEEIERGSIDARVEALPPVTTDGRVTDLDDRPPPGAPTRTFDPRYAQAANALESPGDKTPVIESAYGWHVIMLLERVPERRVSLEERRRALSEQIYARRAEGRVEQIVAASRKRSPVSIERAVDDLTARAQLR